MQVRERSNESSETVGVVRSEDIRRIIIEQARRANVGHIGCGLSVADLIAALYTDVLRIPHPDDPDRDRFVLSKGHAALALYAALHLKGWLSEEALNTYCADGSLLGVHPEHQLFGVDFSSGSLGQGLCIGVGAALAARLQGSARRVFVLISDAECNEGSIWEAAMFAAHQRLANLTVLVDLNGSQALGRTAQVLDLAPMGERWRAFGWDVHDVDGHDPAKISATIATFTAPAATDRPHILMARTTFGKGASFMEDQFAWHYLPLSDANYAQAREELAKATRS